MDSKILIKGIHKTKYQMPKISVLLDNPAQDRYTKDGKTETRFRCIELKYACSQLLLQSVTSKHQYQTLKLKIQLQS